MVIDSFVWQLGTLILGGTVTVACLLVGHWAPWVRRLSRIKAYIYGTFSIWAGCMVWHGLNRDWMTLLGYSLIVVVAGATVLVAYRVDGLVRAIRQAEMAEAVDDELSVSL